MTTKTPDRRVPRTRKLLQEALIALVLEKGYETDFTQTQENDLTVTGISGKGFLLPHVTLKVSIGTIPRQPSEVRLVTSADREAISLSFWPRRLT